MKLTDISGVKAKNSYLYENVRSQIAAHGTTSKGLTIASADIKNDKILISKMGKIISRLFPDIDKTISNKIIGDIRANVIMGGDHEGAKNNGFRFEIESDIYDAYGKLDNCGVVSCMSKSPLIHFYDDYANIDILVLYNYNNDTIGRALLWYGVKEDGTNTDYILVHESN